MHPAHDTASFSTTNTPLALIIPCYNEAHRLRLASFREFLANHLAWRIVFVDDGSRDKTGAILAELCREFESQTALVALPQNRGKAHAVGAGLLYAIDTYHPQITGFWDADLATPLATVPAFVELLRRQPEIEMVFGARVKLLGRHVERRPMRHYLGRVFATVVSSLLRLPIYDTQCGAKLFRVAPHTRQIFAEPFLSKWVFDVEILARYLQYYSRDPKRLEALIFEYPLEVWTDVAGSKVHAGDFVVALLDLMRIRSRYL